MDDKLHIEIVTPYGMFYEADVDQLILPALDGEIGIMPGHSPIVIALTPGELRVREGDKVLTAAVSDGFAQIEINNAIVVVGSAEKPEQIDRERAEKSLYRAEQRLKNPALSQRDRERSTRSIMRARARLKIREKNKDDQS